VNIQLNIFGATMMNRVGRHIHGTDIVAVDNCNSANGSTKLL
jgi:hypothetical protein